MSDYSSFNVKYRASDTIHTEYYHQGLEPVQQQPDSTPKEVVLADAPELSSVQAESLQKGQYTPAAEPSGSPHRILGLSRLHFLLVSIAIIVVIGAIVAGAVAGTLGRHHASSSSSSSSPNTTPPDTSPDISPAATTGVNIHSESKLAATNFTDSSGIAHRAVFFQDPTLALIGRFWDEQNKT